MTSCVMRTTEQETLRKLPEQKTLREGLIFMFVEMYINTATLKMIQMFTDTGMFNMI